MNVAVGADHAGYEMKNFLKRILSENGHNVIDVGTHSEEAVDYPDFAAAVAEAVRGGDAERGVIVCGSGVGACVAANKVNGVRAGLCHDTYSARQGVEHDDVNVLCVGARIIGTELAREILLSFMAAVFSNEERHVRRLKKVMELEKETPSLA